MVRFTSRLKPWLFCVIALGASIDCSAEPTTGNEFLATCSPGVTPVQTTWCLGYVSGLLDGAVLGAGKEPIFCLPKGVTVGQVRDMAIKQLKDHPEIRHKSARSSVLLLLNEEFPCEK